MSESGPRLYARHNCLPVARSTAAIHPRTPISPPLEPTITLPFTTIGPAVYSWALLLLFSAFVLSVSGYLVKLPLRKYQTRG